MEKSTAWPAPALVAALLLQLRPAGYNTLAIEVSPCKASGSTP
ncbi:MAG: hypothetical protein U0163_05290 [Gemmatimonadaceae bacterium]